MATRAQTMAPAWLGAALAAGLVAAVVATTNSTTWLLVVVTAVAMIAVSRGSIRVLLALTMVAVILGSGANPFLKDVFFLARFVLYGLLIAALTLRGSDRISIHPVWWLAGSTVFLGVTSIIWSHNRGLTAERALGFLLLITTMFLFSGRRWHSRLALRSDVAAVSGAIAVAIVVSIGLLIWDRDLAYSLIAYGGGDRFTGVFENPNGAGLLISLFIPLALALGATSAGIPRWCWHATIGVAGIVLLLTQARGGLIASAIGVIGFVLFRPVAARRKQLFAMAAAGVVLLPVALGVGLQSEGLRGGLDRFRQEGLQSGRFQAWALAVDLWKQKPLTGWGFGAGDEVFAPLAAPLAATNVFVGSNPHNSYLATLIETGPLGVLAIVGMLVVALRLGMARPRDDLRAGLMGALLAGLVISLVESGMTSAGSMYGFMFWFVIAAIVAFHRERMHCGS